MPVGKTFDFSDPNNQPFDELAQYLGKLTVPVPAETLELLALRQRFTDLTGIVIQTGGNTLWTEENRMVRVAMKDVLGYEREDNCVAHGWNVRYGKGGVWSAVLPIYFGDGVEAEYRVAIAGLEAK